MSALMYPDSIIMGGVPQIRGGALLLNHLKLFSFNKIVYLKKYNTVSFQ